MGEISDTLIERQINLKPSMGKNQMATEEVYYEHKQTKVVKTITNNFEESFFGKKIGKTVYKHKVVFEDGIEGFVSQITDALTYSGKSVVVGDTLCFIPHQSSDVKKLDKLELCNENGETANEEKNDTNHTDSRVTKSVSVSYAKDIAIAFFKDKPNIKLDYIVSETIRIAQDIEKHLLTTNN